MRCPAILLILFISSFCALAQPLIPSENGYRLEADKIYGIDGSYFTAEGQVTVTFKNTVVTADMVTYYPAMNIIEAVGNVTVTDEMQMLNADRVTYNLDTETGVVNNVTGMLNGEYYVCAQSVQKMGKEYYVMEEAIITTCDGPLPDWSFAFQKVKGEIDGYLIGDHTTMNIKDMPFVYLPKFIYPLKVTRQTGLLVPNLGYSTDLGFYFNEDFFWAIDYDKDITLGANYFSERSVQTLGEFRYAGAGDKHIYLAGDIIYDTESTADVSRRWEYISKTNLNFPLGFDFTADAYSVSDSLFMRDFSGFGLYDTTTNLENVFHQYYDLGMRLKWLDWSVYYKDYYKYKDTDVGYTKTSIRQEPSFLIQKYNLPLKFLTMDYSISYDSVYYEEEQASFTMPSTIIEGDYRRLHGEASLYKTFNLNILNITPSVSTYYTRWSAFSDPVSIVEERGNWGASVKKSGDMYSRFLPKVGVQIDMNEIYRSYSKASHGIINTISYEYIPKLEQTGLPDYLDEDIMDVNHEITWTMTNYIRGDKWGAEITAKQGVNINLDDIFSPIELKGYVYMPYFRNTTEATLSYYPTEINSRSGNALISLSNSSYLTLSDLNRFYLKYTYDNLLLNNYNTSFEVGAQFRLWTNLELQYANIWRADNDKMSMRGFTPAETRIGFVWHDQCWSLGLAYLTEKYMTVQETYREYRRDHTIELIFALKGLGGSSFNVFNDKIVY